MMPRKNEKAFVVPPSGGRSRKRSNEINLSACDSCRLKAELQTLFRGAIFTMNKARVIITAIFCLAIAGSLLLPASQADTTKPSSKQVTFNKDVAPIFFKNCAECHRAGEAAPFSVMSYKEVRPWAKSIREKVVNR